MANLGIVSSGPEVTFSYNGPAGQPASPAMTWPATGGNTGMKRDMFVYVPVVAPGGSIAGGGPTTGQLFPVGNR